MKALLLVILAVSALLPGSIEAASLDDAHAAFAAAKYKESTADYQAALDQHGYSAPILYDLGNSWYREGNYAQAILSYKRALLLAPADSDIAANLHAAQKQAGLQPEATAPLAKLTGLLSANGWAWTAGFAWTLLCAGLIARSLVPAVRPLMTGGCFACAAVLTTALLAIAASSGDLRDAVVMDKDAPALISPFSAAQALFTPQAGEMVRIEKSYHDFVLIKDGAGHSGWIAKERITPVIPPA